MVKVKSTGTATLFKNPLLESLSRTNAALTLITFLPIIAAVLLYGLLKLELPLNKILLYSFIAYFCWTFVEYTMHRFVYHWLNEESKFSKRFHYVMHGAHHEYPKDKSRFFLPPAPGIIMAVIFFVLFYLLFGQWAFAAFPGFTLGYLTYVFTHWAIHKFKKPKNVFGYLWDHHNMHHYKYDDKAFGVSNTLWDRIFGTMPMSRAERKAQVQQMQQES